MMIMVPAVRKLSWPDTVPLARFAEHEAALLGVKFEQGL
jgi:hypothetical protein